MRKGFFNTPTGKIVSYLAHDHANATIMINFILKEIDKGDLNVEELKEKTEKIREYIKKADGIVDYTYEQFKKIYNEQEDLG